MDLMKIQPRLEAGYFVGESRESREKTEGRRAPGVRTNNKH